MIPDEERKIITDSVTLTSVTCMLAAITTQQLFSSDIIAFIEPILKYSKRGKK